MRWPSVFLVALLFAGIGCDSDGSVMSSVGGDASADAARDSEAARPSSDPGRSTAGAGEVGDASSPMEARDAEAPDGMTGMNDGRAGDAANAGRGGDAANAGRGGQAAPAGRGAHMPMEPSPDASVAADGGTDASAPAPSDAGLPDAGSGPDEDASVDDDAGTLACDPPDLEGLALEVVVTGQGLETLSAATQPPGSDDWYLIEQGGRISIWRAGTLLPTPFLDVTSEIVIGPGYEDRGLISLAFAPDYASSGLVYVVVTPTTGADANRDLVLQYRRSAEDPDVLDPTTRTKIVEIVGSVSTNFLRNIHNGGRAAFGPDGYLYVAMGDGGGVRCNDVEPDEPQDVTSPFGKILRLDPSRPPPHAAPGNPFARGGDPRVYHYGLRNPYNFSFDRLTGDLYIGDVGQNSYEEIDVAPSGSEGLNFGWAAFEGATVTCPERALRMESVHTPPIFVADRRTSGCTGQFCDYRAVVGGVVYRGSSLPRLQGVYLFGDYVGRRMVGIRRCDGTSSELRTIRKHCDVAFPDERCFAANAGTPEFNTLTGIFEGNDGEIYVVANRDSLLKVVGR